MSDKTILCLYFELKQSYVQTHTNLVLYSYNYIFKSPTRSKSFSKNSVMKMYLFWNMSHYCGWSNFNTMLRFYAGTGNIYTTVCYCMSSRVIHSLIYNNSDNISGRTLRQDVQRWSIVNNMKEVPSSQDATDSYLQITVIMP